MCYSCFRYHKGTDFQANHNSNIANCALIQLFQIPQRYRFSSKSQRKWRLSRYRQVVLDTTKVQIFKQITTLEKVNPHILGVVLDTTKVQIFKQITTIAKQKLANMKLFQIPQRYRFSSKSQQKFKTAYDNAGCFRYHKGTDFQANHNSLRMMVQSMFVVLDTTKVQIFKQITTTAPYDSSYASCFRYHKGTDFQANHNMRTSQHVKLTLFQIPQRYRFSSKSQRSLIKQNKQRSCFRYHKGTDFQANHNWFFLA